jgi:hypothetical protein
MPKRMAVYPDFHKPETVGNFNRLRFFLKTLHNIPERRVPITEDNPEKSKKGLYRIKDN